MSISGVLQRAIERGDLAYLPMELPSDPTKRAVLLSKEVYPLVMGPYANVHHERRAGRLRADLESFVKGEQITISVTPREAGEADFGLLDRPGQSTWDFRSRDPKPALRLIGHFLKKDTFVALDWWPRSRPVSWSSKRPLTEELDWRIACHGCEENWHQILPGLIPVSGTKAERYVAENFNVV